MPDTYLKSLSCPLPDDIAALKGAGEFDLALQLISRRLEKPLPEMLRARLETERQLLPQLAAQFPLTEQQLLDEFRGRIPDFTEADLRVLLLDGKLSFIYVNGVRRYFRRTVSSLIKSDPALGASAVPAPDTSRPALDAVIGRMREHDLALRCRIRAELRPTVPVSGLYRVHLPIPARSMQQDPAEDLTASCPVLSVGAEDACQRTVCLETDFSAGSVTLEYTWTQRPKAVDPLDESLRRVIYPDALPVCEEDLAPQPPHLSFTPYLVSLARELRGGETDPVRTAWRFYEYITTRVDYSFMPPYVLNERGAEFTAVNLHGDCGMQALLFIALCRISGIPARWQSGLYTEPGDVGNHDWAEFYSDRLGWLPVDCSIGGSAFRAGSELRHRFFFGNLDPWRMVANRRYFAPFSPARRFPRADPYDSQSGEVENDDHALRSGEFTTEYTLLWQEETPV